MQKLIVFNNVSLDGYFCDANGDMSWAHQGVNDAEWNDFTAENTKGDGQLLFGRVTYQMMAGYWPTPMATKTMPAVANRMNTASKIVFSRTLGEATWNNTKLVKGDPATEVRKLKKKAGPGMAILGSGTIVSQLAQEGLIDEFQLVVHPIVLGKGRTLFDGIKTKLKIKLMKSRVLGNGCVVVWYERGR